MKNEICGHAYVECAWTKKTLNEAIAYFQGAVMLMEKHGSQTQFH